MKPTLIFKFIGVKTLYAAKNHRTLPIADFYIDCRGIAEKGIPGTTGLDPKFQAEVKKQSPESLDAMEALIVDGLRMLPARRAGDLDPYALPYNVLFFCAHGVHRSRASCMIIADRLRKKGYKVETPQAKSFSNPQVLKNKNLTYSLGEKLLLP